MQYILILDSEHAQRLYTLMQSINVDRVKNRIRWKFLKVIEPEVFDYEEKVAVIKDELDLEKEKMTLSQVDQKLTVDQKIELKKKYLEYQKKVEEEAKKLRKTEHKFVFNDRENWVQGEKFFNDIPIGSEKGEELKGQDSKLINEIEDAFLYVEKVEEDKKDKKK